MRNFLYSLLILCLLTGCASSAGFRSAAGFVDAVMNGVDLKRNTALSTSMSTFGVGFGILEGMLFGMAALKAANNSPSDFEEEAKLHHPDEPVSPPHPLPYGIQPMEIPEPVDGSAIDSNAGQSSPPSAGEDEQVIQK